MKKILVLLIVAVMALSLFAGCGDDPLYDDFANYLNVEMVDVNSDYEKITEEVSKWEAFEEDSELATSLSDVLLPLVEGSLEKLEGITPETEEVKAVTGPNMGKVDNIMCVGHPGIFDNIRKMLTEIADEFTALNNKFVK